MAYRIFRELDNGELVDIANHSNLESAEAFVDVLREHWPGVYLIREVEDSELK